MLNKKNGLSRYRIEKAMRCFCADLTATQTATLLGLNRKTANRYFDLFRAAIAVTQERDKAAFAGVVEADESFFGAQRTRGRPGPRKRGRGTLKQPVFGIFERGGRICAELIADVKAQTLQAVIRGRVALGAVLLTDGWPGYNGLVDVGYDRHPRINKSQHFAENGVHINGIESFWSFTKRRLARFNGVRPNFALHLKECEGRWAKDFDTLLREIKRSMA